MELHPHEKTLLYILRAALRGQKADPAQLPEDTDWKRLRSLAVQHKLLPLIVSALPPDRTPEGQMVKREVIQQAVTQTLKTKAFLELYTAMRAAGFHPLVVKGIVCRGLYPQGDLRPSSDEDLYVSDQEFSACCQFLRDYGMAPTNEDTPEAYEIGWRKAGSPLYIELHRRLFDPDAQAYGDLEAFFDLSQGHTAEYPADFGETVTSLPPHEHMLYLLLHAYKHFLYSGFGIRQVCDIGLWAEKYHDQIDWALLARQCDRCNARKFSAAVFGIARHFLDIPLELPAAWDSSKDFCQPLLTDILSGGIYGSADSDRQHSATVTLNAVAADRTGTRRSLWKSVFLKRENMAKKYPYLKKYPFLLPVAWSQRIVHYLRRNQGPANHLSASITIGNERIQLLKLYDIIE